MSKTNIKKFYATGFALFLILTTTIGFIPVMPVTAATPQEQLSEVQRKLNELNEKKKGIQGQINAFNKEAKDYQSQANSLSAQISLLDTELAEKQLKIDELGLSIQILNEEINTNTAIISQNEFDAQQMQKQVDGKLRNMYLEYKTGIGEVEIDATLDSTDVFKNMQYKGIIIEQTRRLVEDLNEKLSKLEDDKKLLEEKSVQVKRDKQLIDEEQASLNSKKQELSIQRQAFYSMQESARRKGESAKNQYVVLSDQEAKASAEAEALKQQIYNSINSIPSGSYVVAGTIIGFVGCTGVCTGPHLHLTASINGHSVNPCTKLARGPFSSCAGDGTFPKWPLQGTHYFTSGYGNRCWSYNGRSVCRFHDGIDLASPVPGTPIYAAHNGWMIRGKENGCYAGAPVCNNGGANYVVICENKNNCNAGSKTGYWHLK